MSTFTKEQLIEKLQHRISVASGFPESEKAQMDLELARIALASLEAEAVYQFIYNNPYEEGYTEWLDCNKDYFNGVPEDCRRILYTALPAPVSVPDEMEMDDDFDSAFEHGKAVGWNAYRAAMLQSFGNSEQLEPITTAFKLPDGWVACSERMPDDGQHVIILCDGAFVLYAQYRDGEFFDVVRNGDEFFETQSRNVTDWMPLPSAPQQEA